ncbi:MAG: hypothetical protein ACI855_004060, partial [Myxococcota bacterium]
MALGSFAVGALGHRLVVYVSTHEWPATRAAASVPQLGLTGGAVCRRNRLVAGWVGLLPVSSHSGSSGDRPRD